MVNRGDRLIFALDVDNVHDAKSLVEELGDSVSFYKLGLELFTAQGYFDLVQWLVKKNKKIFIDLKLLDIPRTSAAAVKNLSEIGANLATIHVADDNMLKQVNEVKGSLKILAVTILTSFSQSDLSALNITGQISDIVTNRAKRAHSLGCDGVVCSGLEASSVRNVVSDDFLIVTPGIRPSGQTDDDQKRIVTVKDAFDNGASHVVVGRPIRNASNPAEAANLIQEQIASYWSKAA